jgi:hypothetical protein
MKSKIARDLLESTSSEIKLKVRIEMAETLIASNLATCLIHGAMMSDLNDLGMDDINEDFNPLFLDEIEELLNINTF